MNYPISPPRLKPAQEGREKTLFMKRDLKSGQPNFILSSIMTNATTKETMLVIITGDELI